LEEKQIVIYIFFELIYLVVFVVVLNEKNNVDITKFCQLFVSCEGYATYTPWDLSPDGTRLTSDLTNLIIKI